MFFTFKYKIYNVCIIFCDILFSKMQELTNFTSEFYNLIHNVTDSLMHHTPSYIVNQRDSGVDKMNLV